MDTFVAFLRGIGPGSPNMTNDKLRGVFESLGFHNVRSVISSGNIIFEAPPTDNAKLESGIQAALKAKLGIGGGTIVRTGDKLATFAETQPFGDLEHSKTTYLTVTFLKDKTAIKNVTLPYESPDKSYKVLGLDSRIHAVYAITNPILVKTPDFMTWLEKQYGKDITTRTWKTIERIVAKL